MDSHIANLLEDIRHTLRYREGVEKLSERFKKEQAKTIEELIEILIVVQYILESLVEYLSMYGLLAFAK